MQMLVLKLLTFKKVKLIFGRPVVPSPGCSSSYFYVFKTPANHMKHYAV